MILQKTKSTLFLLLLLSSSYLHAQTRNMEVEGEGDQMILIESTDSGNVGLELVRGDQNNQTDWRVLNDNGNFRIQNQTNNFSTNGSNQFSILENGNFGFGCTNPGTKLSICGGELSFSAGFTGDPGDKISLNGYLVDQISMVGLGYETSNQINGSGQIAALDNLYFKTEGSYNWYSGSNANLGVNSIMTLNSLGNLGIQTDEPETSLHIASGEEASLTENGFLLLGSPNSSNLILDQNEIQARFLGGASNLFINPAGGDAYICNTLNVDRSSNNVGIGTSSPDEKLQIVNGTDANGTGGGYILLGQSNSINLGIDDNEIQARTNGTESNLYLQNSGGNISVGASEPNTNGLMTLQGAGTQMHIRNDQTGGANWWFGASSDNWLVGGQKFVFDDDGNSSNPILMLDAVGESVAVGFNRVPDGYAFAVDGNIICEEVRVEMSGTWPDYVFEKEYKLMSLTEVENSIKANGHLPGIPSAKEIEADGIEVADMQKRMMEKIEELTLYVIELEKKVKALEHE